MEEQNCEFYTTRGLTVYFKIGELKLHNLKIGGLNVSILK